VISHSQQNFVTLSACNLPLDFGESEMDDVVMVNFLSTQIIAHIDPELMQKVDLLGSKTWRVGSQIKNLFLAGRIEDFESDSRSWFGHAFPRKSDIAGLFGDRHF